MRRGAGDETGRGREEMREREGVGTLCLQNILIALGSWWRVQAQRG
jgi:hypothetical protein